MHKYRVYLFLQGLTVITVLGLFRWIEDHQMAGLIAGILFLVTSSGISIFELRFGQGIKSFSFWGCLIFLLFSGLPIFFLRIANWGMPFELITLGPWNGPQLHRASNYIFLVMMVFIFIDTVKIRFQKEQAK